MQRPHIITALVLFVSCAVILFPGLFPSLQIPLAAVIVENHEDARPHQRGISQALLVEEWPVEGMISRFALIFDARRIPGITGPVRSLRPYFVDAVSPWNINVLYAGGSPTALENVAASATANGMNGLAPTYFNAFHREKDISAPHNLFIRKKPLQRLLAAEPTSDMAWPPYALGPALPAPAAKRIAVTYYNPAHDTKFVYQSHTGKYVRSNGTEEDQAKPRNIIMIETPIKNIGEHGRLHIPLYKGSAILFRSGMVYEGTWKKKSDGWFEFTNTQGRPLLFARGQARLMAIPSFERISWE